MKTIGSMGLCPAGRYKRDPALKLVCKLCRVSSCMDKSLELTWQRRCNQKLRCCAVRATLKEPFSFLQKLYLSLPWLLQGIHKIRGRLLLPFCPVYTRKRWERTHPGCKALCENNTFDNLSSVRANKDSRK